jgi:hypothetical protein
MRGGDYSAVLGTTPIGIDDLGRPEYANEILRPVLHYHRSEGFFEDHPESIPEQHDSQGTTQFSCPRNSQQVLSITESECRAWRTPNYAFDGNTSTQADQVGIRIDHEFNQNNTVFFRFNRSNNNVTSPEGFPGYEGEKSNYSRALAGGYTHVFSPNTILNIRYGYTQTSFSVFDTLREQTSLAH